MRACVRGCVGVSYIPVDLLEIALLCAHLSQRPLKLLCSLPLRERGETLLLLLLWLLLWLPAGLHGRLLRRRGGAPPAIIDGRTGGGGAVLLRMAGTRAPLINARARARTHATGPAPPHRLQQDQGGEQHTPVDVSAAKSKMMTMMIPAALLPPPPQGWPPLPPPPRWSPSPPPAPPPVPPPLLPSSDPSSTPEPACASAPAASTPSAAAAAGAALLPLVPAPPLLLLCVGSGADPGTTILDRLARCSSSRTSMVRARRRRLWRPGLPRALRPPPPDKPPCPAPARGLSLILF
eukprot:COSAG01_NODE_5922_length_3950_cov_3.461958_3_plen_293_part_00